MQPGGVLDSRLRGNDRACRETSLPGVWGCPPDSLLSPQEWGPRGLKPSGGERLDSRFSGNDKRGAGFVPNRQGTLTRPGTTHS
jgi:hypothetical protein